MKNLIYFPMSCDILTPGHIMALEYLAFEGNVIIGLLTEKALKGYKKTVVPYKDRKFILEHLSTPRVLMVVPQDSLDFSENIEKYHCDTVASGDGWEKEELAVIKKYKLKTINIKLKDERTKLYSSSKIKQRICEES